jgi:type I restriction enzyme S subunit
MSELYQLPDGWEWKTIEDLCEILDRLRKPISQKDRISGEFPYYGASGILDYINDFIFDERLLLIGEDGAKWGANENTSFIADGKYWVNNHAHIMRPNKDLVIDSLLVYYLNATDLDEYITGATVKKLNQQKLKSIKIPLPPLSEQQRIVSRLDKLFEKIDKAIALHQKNMDEANAFMGSVLNDVFGELEEKYETKTLNEVSKIISGYAFKSGDFSNNNEIKSIKITNVGVNSFVEDDENRLPKSFLDKLSKYTVCSGDIVIALTRPYISNGLKVTFVPNSYDGAFVNQRVAAIQSKDNISSINFIYHYLCTSYVLTNVMELSKTLNQPNLSIKDLSNFELPLPPLLIQQKVVKYLDEISEKIEKVKQAQKEKMDSLKALKASILDRAFRGEL